MTCLSRLDPYAAWLVERIAVLLQRHDTRVQRKAVEQNNRRTSEAMRRYQREGRRMSSQPPYGWRIDPMDRARLTENPFEQQIVARIVRERAAGRSFQAIAHGLTEDGSRRRMSAIS